MWHADCVDHRVFVHEELDDSTEQWVVILFCNNPSIQNLITLINVCSSTNQEYIIRQILLQLILNHFLQCCHSNIEHFLMMVVLQISTLGKCAAELKNVRLLMFDIKVRPDSLLDFFFLLKRIYALHKFNKASNQVCDVSLNVFNDVLRKKGYKNYMYS